MALVFSPSVENLIAQLTRLPGIGSRTAQRLAFHILQRPKDEALALAAALEEVKERVRFCRDCGNLTEEELCGICLDARRDHTVICVVEQPVDVVSLERTAEFRGLYHVLGGALSPIDGVDPSDLRIDELLRRVGANGVHEAVLATDPNMTGDASVTSSVPVTPAAIPTHGERRHAASAVRRNIKARPESKPDHARSQRVVR